MADFGTVIVNEVATGCLHGYAHTGGTCTGDYQPDTSAIGEKTVVTWLKKYSTQSRKLNNF